MSVAVLSFVHVSSNSDKSVSSELSLSRFSVSSSPLILFTISRSISKICSSVSSRCFFSPWIVSTKRWESSFVYFCKALIVSSRSLDALRIYSCNLGKSYSKHCSRCSMFSNRAFDSLAISPRN